MDIPVDKLPNIIFACFVLHNFCERQNADLDTQMVEQIILDERSNTDSRKDKIHSYTTPLGRRIRDTITMYYKQYL